MRRVRIVLIVAMICGGTAPMLRAQMAHSPFSTECGCQSCVANCVQDPCCTPLLTSLARGVKSAVGAVLPCKSHCDARHQIYMAALRRNAFDKKCFPFLPFYSYRCCGGHPTAACPHCGPAGHGEEEWLETHEHFDGMMLEPTPAAPLPAETVPQTGTADQEARRQQWKGRVPPRSAQRLEAPTPAATPARQDRVADVPPVPSNLRVVAPSPVQRAGLQTVQPRAAGDNSLRK